LKSGRNQVPRISLTSAYASGFADSLSLMKKMLELLPKHGSDAYSPNTPSGNLAECIRGQK
jgi:hypothetical protein